MEEIQAALSEITANLVHRTFSIRHDNVLHNVDKHIASLYQVRLTQVLPSPLSKLQ
jgi:hypothetical protein